jgi:hypothetical protein
MTHTILPAIGFAFALCVPASGQTTWIIDAAGGTGSHFRDLPPAVQKAVAGDILVMRKGAYKPTTISKGLRLIGEAGATILTAAFPEVPLRIKNVPAKETCVVESLTIRGKSGLSVLAVADNLGRVVLGNLVIGYTAMAGQHALAIQRSRAVIVNRCAVDMGAAIVNSTVSIVGSTFVRRFAVFPINGSAPAITAANSTLELTRVSATGQRGFLPYLGATSALYSTSSVVRVLGDSTSVFRAGSDQRGTSVPALLGNANSSLEIDPKVTLRPSGTAKGHAGFKQVRSRRLPALVAGGGVIGGTITVDLWSPKGHPFALAVSLPGIPVRVPPLGRIWLDPAVLVLVAIGTQGTTEMRRATIAVPNTPRLRGLTLAWQASSGPPASAEFTNPAVVVVR